MGHFSFRRFEAPSSMLLIALSAMVMVAGLASVAIASSDDVVVSGEGFGHGHGMSQYGANEMASQGFSFDEILGFYYPTTTLEQYEPTTDLWVSLEFELLRAEMTAVRRFPQGLDEFRLLEGGEEVVVFHAGDTIEVNYEGLAAAGHRLCSVVISGSESYDSGAVPCDFDILWDGQEGPANGGPELGLSFGKVWQNDSPAAGDNCGTGNLRYGEGSWECELRYGKIHIRPDSAAVLGIPSNECPAGQFSESPTDCNIGFAISVELDMEGYADGIGEMPPYWNAEALKAQAVAARSFAENVNQSANNSPEYRNWCWCDLYRSTRHQNYDGYRDDWSEWSDAVAATAGEMITYLGLPAFAQYGSSNPGFTVANVYPYLAAFPDPYSDRPWSTTMSRSSLASALGFDTIDSVTEDAEYAIGVDALFTFEGTKDGSPKSETFTGQQLDVKLNLVSRWVADFVVTVPPNPGDEFAISQDTAGVLDVAQSGDLFGEITISGDFDNDGTTDLVVGVERDGVGGLNDAGLIQVFYGGGLWTNDRVLHQDSPGIYGVAEVGDRFGASLAVGDFNGDGFDDLAVGTPGEDIGSITDAGAVTVLFGSEAGLTSEGSEAWHQDTRGVRGKAESGDAFGSALAAGDFNGDGIDDLAVGVPGEAIGSIVGAGAVAVLPGSSDGLTSVGDLFLHQDTDGLLGTADAGDGFGSVLVSGDINGDGFADLVVGVPREDVGTTVDAGVIHTLFGGDSGLSTDGDQLVYQDVPGVGGVGESGDMFGASLAVGDVNGDGRVEVAVGSPGESIGSQTSAGLVHVFNGTPSGIDVVNDVTIHQGSPGVAGSPEPYDRFGYAVAFAEANGAAGSDLLIGIPGEDLKGFHDAGMVSILYSDGSTITTAGDLTVYPGKAGIGGTLSDDAVFGTSITSMGSMAVFGAPGLVVGQRLDAGAFYPLPL